MSKHHWSFAWLQRLWHHTASLITNNVDVFLCDEIEMVSTIFWWLLLEKKILLDMITPFKKNKIPNITCVMHQTKEFHTLWFLYIILYDVPVSVYLPLSKKKNFYTCISSPGVFSTWMQSNLIIQNQIFLSASLKQWVILRTVWPPNKP